MLKLDKVKYGNNCEGFYIITDDGTIFVSRIDFDLYIRPDLGFGKNDKYPDQKNEYSFKINNENEIYDIFDRLYTAIKTRKPYSNSIYDFEEKNYILPSYVDLNSESKLFVDDRVCWHSDEFDYDESSIFFINKEDDCFELTFKQSESTKISHPTFDVKISNASDRYFHFSTTFMNMYHELDDYYEKENNKGLARVL